MPKTVCVMKTVEKAYKSLWKLIDKEQIHLHTLDFTSVCERLHANEAQLNALLEEELGYNGAELLLALRQRHLRS